MKTFSLKRMMIISSLFKMSILFTGCSNLLDQPIEQLDENQLKEIIREFPEISTLVEGVQYYSPKFNTPRHLLLDENFQRSQSFFKENIEKITFNDLIEYKKLRDEIKVNPTIQFGGNQEKILVTVDSLQKYFKPFHQKESIENLVTIELLELQKDYTKLDLSHLLTRDNIFKPDIIKFRYKVKLKDEGIDMIKFEIKLNGIPSEYEEHEVDERELELFRYTISEYSFPKRHKISSESNSYEDNTTSRGVHHIYYKSKLKSIGLVELKKMTSIKLLTVEIKGKPVYYKVTPKILQNPIYPSTQEFLDRITIGVNYLDGTDDLTLPDFEEIWKLIKYRNSIVDYVHQNMNTIMLYNFLNKTRN